MASKDLAEAEAPANRLLSKIKDEQVSRHPSPQPTHFTVPLSNGRINGQNGHNGHRVLRSATVGYIAPEFKGKEEQMATGKPVILLQSLESAILLTSHSQGNHHKG